MAKVFTKCKLCKASKFVNYIGLCKRCNKKQEAHNITEHALEERMERIDSRKKEVVKEAEVKAVEDAKAQDEEVKEDKEEKKTEK